MDGVTIVSVYAADLNAAQRDEKQRLQERCFADVPYQELVEDFVASPLASVLAYHGPALAGCVSVYKRGIVYEGEPVVLGGFGGTCTCPELRGHGIGTAVCRAALEILHRERCDVAFLAVGTSKGTAPFYERLGFTLLGRPFTYVNARGETKRPASDDVGMLAPVTAAGAFERIMRGKQELALGPEPGYW